MATELSPITDADVPEVAAFLHRHLNDRVSPALWGRAMRVPWPVDAPNHGFLLRTGSGDPRGAGATGRSGEPSEGRDGATGRVVGAYLAFYSERSVAGRRERFCNLGAWCVLPEHRLHSVRLLKALLAQPGYHFTDLSPSGPVVRLNERLGFTHLDTATALVPNLPWPPRTGGARVTTDPDLVERGLSGRELELYRDHARAAAARHLLVSRGDRRGYVVFRRVRRRDLPLFAAILHASDPELLARSWRAVSSHLLLRHGIPATLAETRVAGTPPPWSRRLASSRPKMFRSDRLPAEAVEDLDLYSELTCVPW